MIWDEAIGSFGFHREEDDDWIWDVEDEMMIWDVAPAATNPRFPTVRVRKDGISHVPSQKISEPGDHREPCSDTFWEGTSSIGARRMHTKPPDILDSAVEQTKSVRHYDSNSNWTSQS